MCVEFLMFVLTPVDDLCYVWFICPVLYWFWYPEIGTSSVDWTQLSRILPEDEDESSLRNVLK
jgi:hypothetical protein